MILEDKKRETLARTGQGRRTDLEDLDKKSCQSSKEKNALDRKNKTDYKIAKAAGTSEDTVRKVRVINEKATKEPSCFRIAFGGNLASKNRHI